MWLEEQRQARRRHWADVDRLLNELPPLLFRQAKLLQYNLALRYSESGQFSDVFLGPDQLPILSVPGWLLEDLEVPAGPGRDEIERRLFLVSVLLSARSHAIESAGDPASFIGDGQVALPLWLSERAAAELARVVPRDSPFWEHYEALIRDDAERLLEERERRTESNLLAGDPEAYLTVRCSSAVQLPALAATTVAGRDADASRITEMLGALAQAFQILADVGSMHRDLQQGRPTHPIAVVARTAGIPLRPWPDPALLLGAMVATGSLGPILQSAVIRVQDCRRAAVDLHLPTFTAYLADVELRVMQRTAQVLGGAPAPPRDLGRSPPLLTVAEPMLPKALAMAEGFLLADRTFKESWETHREGMLGAAEVASRFPAGLILEILCAHSHDLSPQVDEFLAFATANGFRYYDHPWSDADSDTVGVFLRLLPYATPGPKRDQAPAAVLSCLERLVHDNGTIPVWITGCDEPHGGRPAKMALGEGCGTVAAHLLLGLIGMASDRYRDTIETGVLHLMNRICDVGLGANVNYPPYYALAVFFRLIARLQGSNVAQARRSLLAELEQATAGRLLRAQEAALVAVACFDADRTDLLDRAWMTTILKQQRFDGSWIGEPFAAAPNRGGWVSWYSSATLTTALCYDALGRYAVWRDRSND